MSRAVLLMFVAMSLIPAGDAAGKLLSMQGVSPLFVAWSRFGLGALMVIPFFGSGVLRLMTDWRIWLRGGLLTGGITLIQFALREAPVGDVFAAFFVGPVFSFVLAGLFLKEPMTRLRSAMVLLGFAGVLLVVRPGMTPIPGLGYAVAAGLCYGGFLTASRWLSAVAEPGQLLVSQLGIGAILLTPFAWPLVPAMSLDVSALTFGSALASMLGNLILLFAYRLTPATVLAPLVYFQLLSAILFGWFIFGDLPDTLTWVGIITILGAGTTAARARSY